MVTAARQKHLDFESRLSNWVEMIGQFPRFCGRFIASMKPGFEHYLSENGHSDDNIRTFRWSTFFCGKYLSINAIYGRRGGVLILSILSNKETETFTFSHLPVISALKWVQLLLNILLDVIFHFDTLYRIRLISVIQVLEIRNKVYHIWLATSCFRGHKHMIRLRLEMQKS